MDDRTDVFKSKEYGFISDLKMFPPLYLLGGLAMLGNVSVERPVLEKWLGGHYTKVLEPLLRKKIIREHKPAATTELFLCEDTAESLRKQLKPELSRCEWIRTLCESIVEFLEKEALATKRITPRNCILPDEVTTERLHNMSRLLSDILMYSEYNTPESISLCVTYLTRTFSDNIDCLWRYHINLLSLLERCISAPEFDEISDKMQFETYCLKIMALLEKINKTDAQKEPTAINEFSEQILDCMDKAERILAGLSESEQTQNAYRLCLPVVETICYGNIRAHKIQSCEDALFRLCETVLSYFDGIPLPEEKASELWRKYNYYRAIVEKWTASGFDPMSEECLLSCIFDSDKSYDELTAKIEKSTSSDSEPLSDEQLIRLAEHLESREQFKESLCIESTGEEFRNDVAKVLAEEQHDKSWILSYLTQLIDKLGFEPGPYYVRVQHLLSKSPLRNEPDDFDDPANLKRAEEAYWEEIRCRCADKENQKNAQFLLDIAAKIDHNNDCVERCIVIQTLTLACCMGDFKAIDDAIDKFYTFFLRDLSVSISDEEIEQRYITMIQLGQTKCASRFFAKGIVSFEAECLKPETTDNDRYLLCQALIVLAECADDQLRKKHYQERQLDTLGLGFRFR